MQELLKRVHSRLTIKGGAQPLEPEALWDLLAAASTQWTTYCARQTACPTLESSMLAALGGLLHHASSMLQAHYLE